MNLFKTWFENLSHRPWALSHRPFSFGKMLHLCLGFSLLAAVVLSFPKSLAEPINFSRANSIIQNGFPKTTSGRQQTNPDLFTNESDRQGYFIVQSMCHSFSTFMKYTYVEQARRGFDAYLGLNKLELENLKIVIENGGLSHGFTVYRKTLGAQKALEDCLPNQPLAQMFFVFSWGYMDFLGTMLGLVVPLVVESFIFARVFILVAKAITHLIRLGVLSYSALVAAPALSQRFDFEQVFGIVQKTLGSLFALQFGYAVWDKNAEYEEKKAADAREESERKERQKQMELAAEARKKKLEADANRLYEDCMKNSPKENKICESIRQLAIDLPNP